MHLKIEKKTIFLFSVFIDALPNWGAMKIHEDTRGHKC